MIPVIRYIKHVWQLLGGKSSSYPVVMYGENGRDGYVFYRDEKGDIQMYYEFGGTNCVAIISIPTEKEWVSKTKRPLTERNRILQFVAEQVIIDKSPNSHYKITGSSIEIFENK